MPTTVADAPDRYRHIALWQLRKSCLTETIGITVLSRCIEEYPRLSNPVRTLQAIYSHDERSIHVQCQNAVAALGPKYASSLRRSSRQRSADIERRRHSC
jgi:hypothetical protein